MAPLLVGASLLGSFACSGSRTEGIDPSKLPEDMRDDYALFARRCSKCHSLARPLTAGITDDRQWVLYVNRMRRQPGSGISPDDQEHILRFLRYYAGELRRQEAEKKAPPPSSSTPGAPPPAAQPPAAPPPLGSAPSAPTSTTGMGPRVKGEG
jgi:hypothetical protein